MRIRMLVPLVFFALTPACVTDDPSSDLEATLERESAVDAELLLSDAVLVVDGKTFPIARTPTRHQANVKFGDITIEISGDERNFNDWLDLSDGGLVDGEIVGVDAKKERRRATFTGAQVTEVKLEDLDANNNKKPYTLTYRLEADSLEEAKPGAGDLPIGAELPVDWSLRIPGADTSTVFAVTSPLFTMADSGWVGGELVVESSEDPGSGFKLNPDGTLDVIVDLFDDAGTQTASAVFKTKGKPKVKEQAASFELHFTCESVDFTNTK
jgi:hypothetical protein